MKRPLPCIAALFIVFQIPVTPSLLLAPVAIIHLLVTARELATTGRVSEVLGFWIVSGLAFVLLLVAWALYRLAMPFIVERMSA